MLKIENIRKVFNPGTINEKVALDGVDLTLEEGEFVTVIGGNGAGKSTTLNAVAGVWPVDSGKIYIGGEDVTKLSEHRRAQYLVSIVLIAVVLVMFMRNNNSMTNARPLVYRESLDEVAAQINGETLTLRDMAFYVGYEEYQIQQEALVYDPDDPNRYWSMRVEGGFMNAVARKNAMQMALHDELFYQMAMEESITLDDNDQKHMDNKLEDFWEDLTERQGETALGISKKDAKKTIQRIAYAQKYQEVYAQLHNRTYDDYAYMEDSYQKLLKKQKYKVNAKVWNRVSFGNVTYNYKKKVD